MLELVAHGLGDMEIMDDYLRRGKLSVDHERSALVFRRFPLERNVSCQSSDLVGRNIQCWRKLCRIIVRRGMAKIVLLSVESRLISGKADDCGFR